MIEEPGKTEASSEAEKQQKSLRPEAQRALAEAEARRKAAEAGADTPWQKEFQGPKGPEPTRYGDWERKGIASDFCGPAEGNGPCGLTRLSP